MYAVSVWASRHRWPARIAIVVLYGILTALALFIGATLQLFQIPIPVAFFYAAAGLFLIVFLSYPAKGQKRWFRNFYRYRKSCDAILVGATFFFIVCIGNQPETLLQPGTQPAAASVLLPREVVTKPATATEETLKKKNRFAKKALRRLLIQKIQVLRKAYKETSKGGKIALIILSVLVAFGLAYLIVGLSCNIACSGSEGGAILVAILGIGLVTFLLVRVIQRIQRGPKRRTKEPPL